MSSEFNEENLKEAYCKVVACTGIGAVDKNCQDVLEKQVKVAVPESMHEDYPARILGCANQVCTTEPYLWRVTQREPVIEDDTTFDEIFKNWFKRVVRPV